MMFLSRPILLLRNHSRYIVGTRACKHNRIEKSQKRLKCKPGHSDKDETQLHPSDGGNTDDSNYWDDFTDDESKISLQTAKKPKKHCLKKSKRNRNTTEVDNEVIILQNKLESILPILEIHVRV